MSDSVISFEINVTYVFNITIFIKLKTTLQIKDVILVYKQCQNLHDYPHSHHLRLSST